jgi:hypothetical protein
LLPPGAERCAYCGTVPAAFHAALQARQAQAEQVAAQQAAFARAHAGMTIAASARNTLLWGVLTALCICSPVTAILAFTSYSRTKESARQAGVALPGHARAGFWLALLGLVWFVAFWGYMALDVQRDNERADARKAELSQKLAKADPSKLDHDTACALAELHVRTAGYGGEQPSGRMQDFVCAGTLKTEGPRASLEDFKFRLSSSSGVTTVAVCLKHGDRWFVDRLSTSGCDLDKAAETGADAGKADGKDASKKAPSKKASPAPSR